MPNKSTNNFVVYRSSAGSGKTYTLVKEYIKLLLTASGNDYFKHILAITFTNKASAEMKDRILNALEEFSSDEEHSSKALLLLKQIENEINLPQAIIIKKSKVILNSILHHYSDFSISTIDKFTHRIVRTFARDLHLPLNFEVYLDKDDIMEQAIDLLIEQIGENEHITKILTEFAISNIEDEKSWSPRNSILSFAKQLFYVEGSEDKISTLKKIDVNNFNSLRKNLKQNITVFEDYITSKAEKAFALINETGLDYSFFAGGERAGITKYFTYVINHKIESFFPTPQVVKYFEKEILYAKSADKTKQEIINRITPQLILFFNEIYNYINENYSRYYLYYSALKNICSLSLITYIDKYIDQLQGDNNLLLLANFNKLINNIVITEPVPFVYERIGERYHHCMIDEFQDTSILQWQNLLPLVENSLASGYFNMLVGDAKQSIYRWRGGVSEQFTNLPKIYPDNSPHLIKEKEATLAYNYIEKKLDSNYRSCREIIEFNNDFFSLLSKSVGECAELYNDVIQNFNPVKTGGYIQIDLLPHKTTLNDDDYFFKLESIINDLLNEGYQYKDIAVLTSVNKEGACVAEYLSKKNINVISPDSLSIKSSNSVNLLVASLTVLALPFNNLARVSFIKAYLIYTNNTNNFTTLAFENKETNNSLKKFFKSITYVDVPIEDVLSLPLPEQCEYLIRTILKPISHDAYLLCFIDAVNDFCNRKGGDITSFLEWWKDYSDKVSVKMPESLNAISLFSVHKSKGLEFPVVIFFYANKKERNQKEYFWVENSLENKQTIPYLLIKGNKNLENTTLKDEYNLEVKHSKLDLINEMYVAFTRPINRFYILCNSLNETKKVETENKKTFYINHFISHYLSKKKLLSKDKTTYSFGKKVFYKSEKENKNNDTQFKHEMLGFEKSNDWHKKIKISRMAPENWNTYSDIDVRAYGTYIHKILQNAVSSESIMINENIENINPEIFNEIIKLALLLWKMSDIEKYLEKGYTQLSEVSILAEQKQHIPDKVLMKEKEVIILDFKTGEKSEKHIAQINTYAELYTEMGFIVKRAAIIYRSEILNIIS